MTSGCFGRQFTVPLLIKVRRDNSSKTNTLADYCDGRRFASHPLNAFGPWLQVMFQCFGT